MEIRFLVKPRNLRHDDYISLKIQISRSVDDSVIYKWYSIFKISLIFGSSPLGSLYAVHTYRAARVPTYVHAATALSLSGSSVASKSPPPRGASIDDVHTEGGEGWTNAQKLRTNSIEFTDKEGGFTKSCGCHIWKLPSPSLPFLPFSAAARRNIWPLPAQTTLPFAGPISPTQQQGMTSQVHIKLQRYSSIMLHYATMFQKWGFGEFPCLVGRYCRYLLPKLALAIFSNNSNKTLRQTGWIALYNGFHPLMFFVWVAGAWFGQYVAASQGISKKNIRQNLTNEWMNNSVHVYSVQLPT